MRLVANDPLGRMMRVQSSRTTTEKGRSPSTMGFARHIRAEANCANDSTRLHDGGAQCHHVESKRLEALGPLITLHRVKNQNYMCNMRLCLS